MAVKLNGEEKKKAGHRGTACSKLIKRSQKYFRISLQK